MIAEDQRPLPCTPSVRMRHGLRHQVMVRREIANRICIGRIAREQVSLAATTAEVPALLGTTAAWLLHPGVAAEVIETGRVVPDPPDTRLAYAGQCQVGQHARRVTWERYAIRCNREKHRTQTLHACLRSALEVIGHDEIDLHAVADSLAEAVGRCLCAPHLLATGHELLAVEPSPTVVLRVRELDVLGAHLLRHVENLSDMIDVVTVQN